jgi:hypothetical protein
MELISHQGMGTMRRGPQKKQQQQQEEQQQLVIPNQGICRRLMLHESSLTFLLYMRILPQT